MRNGPPSRHCLPRIELEEWEGGRAKFFGCRRQLEAIQKRKRTRWFVEDVCSRHGDLLANVWIGNIRLYSNSVYGYSTIYKGYLLSTYVSE